MQISMNGLSVRDQAWLDATFVRNRARFGDLHMEAEGQAAPEGQAAGQEQGAGQQDVNGAGEPQVGPDGFPADTPWRDMRPEHQAAYWRHQAKSHEREKKAAWAERDSLKPKAEKFEALGQADQDEKDRQIAALNQQIEAANNARAAERVKHAGELVTARLSAAADKKGMSAQALLTLAGRPERFLGDEGVDTEAVDDFLAALPDKDTSSGAQDDEAQQRGQVRRLSLGGGPRGGAKPDGLQQGEDLYASRHKRKPPA